MPDIEIALLVDRMVRRIHAGLHQRAVVFDTDRIGPMGGMILLTIADIEPAPVQELVRHMARDKSQMTRAVQTLEHKGLVDRIQSDTDARVSLLSLTTKGQRTVKLIRKNLAEVIDEVLAPLPPDKKNALKDLLQQVVP